MAQRVLSHEKIKPVWDSAVTEILDCKLDKVTGVRPEKSQDRRGKRAAVRRRFYRHWPRSPTRNFFKGVLDMDENGYIIPLQGTATKNPRRVRCRRFAPDHVYRQAITAAGSGWCRPIDAERFLPCREN